MAYTLGILGGSRGVDGHKCSQNGAYADVCKKSIFRP